MRLPQGLEDVRDSVAPEPARGGIRPALSGSEAVAPYSSPMEPAPVADLRAPFPRPRRGGSPMGRLIVVSNRVSAPTGEGAGNQGGLAMALSAALREYDGIWVGWSGETVETFTGELNYTRAHGVTLATMDLEEQDVDEYYNGYANKTLWPLFHYRIDLTAYDRSFGMGYERVNARFAETLASVIQPDDVIWVHDYHFIPLGRELRKRGIQNPIGFFLHIPWPPRQLLVTLPRDRQLVESLFEYDLVGLQTEEWLEELLEYLVREADGEMLDEGYVQAFGRRTRFASFPIGIDAQDFRALSTSLVAKRSYDRMVRSAGDRKLILGVDRLDYSKGLPDRFLAYECFLTQNPEFRGEVFLLQIAPPSRTEVEEYQAIRSRLDELTGRINGEFAEVDWVPIRYVNQGYRRDQLAGIYRAAQIGLVTPLRDGMNLVAKEYVAAQDPEDPGVLILSRFSGAAQQMQDALIVNPFDQEDVSDALKRGLLMSWQERVRRWEALIDGIMKQDVVGWREDFVAALGKAGVRRQEA
jgi:trehalose 6-phosphate synthase